MKELWLYHRIQGYTTEAKSVNNILRRLTLYYPVKYGSFGTSADHLKSVC